MLATFAGVDLTINCSRLIGFWSFLVSIFVFQAAFRGSGFNRTICSPLS
jgi:hypothetical protein